VTHADHFRHEIIDTSHHELSKASRLYFVHLTESQVIHLEQKDPYTYIILFIYLFILHVLIEKEKNPIGSGPI